MLALDPVRNSLVHKYSLETNLGCCGRVDNCCGSTCCKPNLILDILDTAGNLTDGGVSKTFGGGGSDACCRYVRARGEPLEPGFLPRGTVYFIRNGFLRLSFDGSFLSRDLD